MTDQEIIKKTSEFVKQKLDGEGTGHDWWHVERVWRTAKAIATEEKANLLVAELGALLHDIADFKFHDGDESVGPKAARLWLESIGVDEKIVEQVTYIVANVSFKGAEVANKMKTIEGLIVQDADRLDAIGAIGIARTFAYGGHMGFEIYNPNHKPQLHESFEEYKKGHQSSLMHFYEKLLLLKDRMNTKTGKKLAIKRHKFMEQFLKQFYLEWNV